MINKIKDLLAYTDSIDNLYLYGAGAWAEKYWQLWSRYNISIDGCIVTQREDNPREFHGRPVFALDELEAAGLNAGNINVIVAMKDSSLEKWLHFFCSKPPFKSVLYVSEALKEDIKLWYWRDMLKKDFELSHPEYIMELHYPGGEKDIGVLLDAKSHRALMRVPSYMGDQVTKECIEHCSLNAFEKLFGTIDLLPYVERRGLSAQAVDRTNARIYVVTSHADRMQGELQLCAGEIMIQAGAALTKYRSGILTDDTGDHISDRNRDYSECTAMYWVWKNARDSQYVGISHYRRRLKIDDLALRYIADNDIDIVPTLPQFEAVSVREFFSDFTDTYDWKLLKRFVCEYDPEYTGVFEMYETGHFYYPCNVFLWKRRWFDIYCNFAFSVTEKIYEMYKRGGVIREDRYMGYLFEQLSSLFVIRHRMELKVACAEMEWIE